MKTAICSSPNGRNGHPLGRRRTEQCLVPCDDDEIWIPHSIRGREVYSVIAPKTVRLRELPCVPGERVIDLDEIELFVSRVELGHRGPKLASCQSSEAVRLCESCATLGIHESRAHNAISPIPQRGGASRADLDNEQRHHRGGIEVRDHLR
jgi:hypothetical protein